MSKLQLLHIHTIIVKNGRKYHSGHEPIGTYLLQKKNEMKIFIKSEIFVYE